MEHIGKKSLLVALAFILASTLMIPLGGGSQRVAWADEIDQADVAETQAGDGSDDQENLGTLNIVSGRAHIVSANGNTVVYSFPNLVVNCSDTSKKFSSITVQFTSAIGTNDLISFNAAHSPNTTVINAEDAGFVPYGGNKHGNRSINNENGATAAEWQSFLRKYLTIQLADKEQKATLRMIVSPTPVTETYDFRAETGHYYKLVTVPKGTYTQNGPDSTNGSGTTVTWTEARDAAEASKYMGMQGYLATITDQAENNFIYSLISSNAWLGATCHPDLNPYNNSLSTEKKYYWVTGPEAGTYFSQGNQSVNGSYVHWNSGEPNNSYGIGYIDRQLSRNDGEYCLHMLGGSGLWNDFPNFPSMNAGCWVQSYIIEYGGMEGDKKPDTGDSTGGTGDVGINLDLEVNIDITLTKPDRIVTEVKDTVVGQPVVVKDTAASGEVVTIVGYDEKGLEKTEPTDVKHIFKKLKPNASGAAVTDWIDVPEDELLNGVPFHAGTYKVTSDATYSNIDGKTVPYDQGSATFTIAPKEIDVTTTATSPTDSSNPDATQPAEIEDANGTKVEVAPRNFDKVYDGTTDWLGAQNFNITDALVNNGQAYVTFTTAAYDNADSGTRSLVLEGVELKGKNAGDYTIKGITADKKLTVQGAIAPRDLVVSTSYVVRGLPVTTWKTGVPMMDSSATNPLTSDLFAHNVGAATQAQVQLVNGKRVWPDNLVAPTDTVIDVLGVVSYTSKTKGGLTLLPSNPQKGMYQLTPSFSKVAQASDGQYYTNKEASGSDVNSVIVHNYRVIFDNGVLSVEGVQPNNLTEDENGNPDPIVITKPVTDPDKPGTKPVGDDEIKDIINDHFNPDSSSPTNVIPEDVDPIITITKGGIVLDEIDPTEPGEYHIHVVYPDPDGTDTEVDIVYIIEPEDTPSETTQVYTVSTKIKGVVNGAVITPTQNVEKGTSAHVEWIAPSYAYVALVEVDGKTVTNTGSFDFANVAANHEVVVTFADMPDIEGSSTNGFYTITVNKYGGSKGVTVSPSQVVTSGKASQITWQPETGYKVTSVMIDGKPIDSSIIEQGSYTFAEVSANHVVDVIFAPVDSQTKMSQTDLLVSTQIVGGPGNITGGSTVSKGESYDVAWNPVIQTTTDPEDPTYAVYEVEKIEVNGVEAAGSDDTHLTLDNIKENKNVVVTMKPVIYNVSILTYGNGTASPSASFYKGQRYAAINATPNGGSHISYIEVDGVKQFDERDVQNGASGQSVLSVLSQSITTALDASLTKAGVVSADKPADNAVASETGNATNAATDPVIDSATKGDSVEGAASDESASDAAITSNENSASESSGEVASSENDASDVETQATSLVTATAEATAAVYAPENTNIKAANTQTLDMDFEGIAKPHVVKVYFAEDANQVNPDEIQNKGNVVTIIPGIEGGPGQITGGGVVDKDDPGTITWTLPDGYETEAIVIDGTSYPVDPDTKTIDLKNPEYSKLLDPNTDHTFTVEVTKRVPGDDALPEPRVPSDSDATDTFTVSTKLTGGPGTISATGIIKAGDPYTVTWSAGEASGVKYRVSKVLIDGVEQPSLLNATSYTFEDLAANHTIEVILEAISQGQDPANNNDQTDSKDKSNQDKANTSSSTSKTADNVPVLPLLMMSVLAASVLVAMRKVTSKKN